MGIIFLFLLAIGVVTFLSYAGTDDGKKDTALPNAVAGFVVSSVILTIVTGIMFLATYNSYIELAQKRAIIEQYKESINLYAEKGVQEFNGLAGSREFTDLKYNNYQTQIGKMITDMRDTIVEYNKDLTGKKLRKDNWFFSWVVILDDDMKLIKMADYID